MTKEWFDSDFIKCRFIGINDVYSVMDGTLKNCESVDMYRSIFVDDVNDVFCCCAPVTLYVC
jgi:hypothetical protein